MTELTINQSNFTNEELSQLAEIANETDQTIDEVLADLTSLFIADTKKGLLDRQKIGAISSDEPNSLELPIACRTEH